MTSGADRHRLLGDLLRPTNPLVLDHHARIRDSLVDLGVAELPARIIFRALWELLGDSASAHPEGSREFFWARARAVPEVRELLGTRLR